MYHPEQAAAFPYGDLDRYVDLGDQHWYVFTTCSESCPGEGLHGLIQPHWRDLTGYPDGLTGTWCGGGVTFQGHNPGGPEWDVLSLSPLHIEPSLLCRGIIRLRARLDTAECGDHGFIRGGRWVRV